ncbi:MAG: hypothetical protein U0547_06040 [Dehalococcoidia bacterium]
MLLKPGIAGAGEPIIRLSAGGSTATPSTTAPGATIAEPVEPQALGLCLHDDAYRRAAFRDAYLLRTRRRLHDHLLDGERERNVQNLVHGQTAPFAMTYTCDTSAAIARSACNRTAQVRVRMSRAIRFMQQAAATAIAAATPTAISPCRWPWV